MPASLCMERIRNGADIEKLKKFLSIFDKFSLVFGVNFIVDAPDGDLAPISVSTTDNAEKTDDAHTIYFHFDCLPPDTNYKKDEASGSLFGFEVGNFERCTLIKPSELPGVVITSTEDIQVAYIIGRDIYTVPGIFLGTDEDSIIEIDTLKRILFQILYWGSPKWVMYTQDFLLKKYDSIRQRIANRLARSLYLEKVKRFVSYRLDSDLTQIEKSIECLKRETEQLNNRFFSLSLEMLDITHALESIRGMIQGGGTGEMFEKILSIKHINTVRVVEKLNTGQTVGGPFIVLNTDNIFQLSADSSKKYELGAFEIIIEMAGMTHETISFLQNRYQGLYKHYWLLERNTCFGGTLNGFNLAIDKLVMDVDVTNLVHLIMSFIIKEITPPTLRPDMVRAGQLKSYTPALNDRYNDNQDREQEKKRFVELVNLVSTQRSVPKLDLRHQELIRLMEKTNQERIKSRWLLKQDERLYLATNERLKSVRANVQKELKRVQDSFGVYDVTVCDREFNLKFMLRDPIENEPFISMLGFTLRIGDSYFPQILFWSSDGSVKRISLYENQRLFSQRIDKATEQAIIEHVGRFEISALLELIRNLILPKVTSPPDPTSGLEVKKQ